MKLSRRQLRKLILEIIEGEEKVTTTSKTMGNIELKIMNWYAGFKMGGKKKDAVAKKVSKWKEENEDMYKKLKSDLKTKVDEMSAA